MDQQRALENVADRYRQEGYSVVLRPTGNGLPGFLASFEPDMIARRNGENVVVQIKLKDELTEDRTLSHLAGAVNAEPGWRFDLVVLNPKTWPDEVPRDATEPTAAGLSVLIDEAGKLTSLQLPRPALIAAWAAVEAAMREAARRQGIALERNYPRFVLNTLHSEGVLSRSEYEQLQESLPPRNAAVHGLETSHKVGPEQAEFLIGLAKRLLELKPVAADS